MRRLTSTAVLVFTAIGLFTATAPAHAKPPVASHPTVGGDLSMLDFSVRAYRVPATGRVFSNLRIQTPSDADRQVVTLRMRSSNHNVFTPRVLVFRGLAPGTTKLVRISIQPGRKARGRAKITVTNGEMLASDTIHVTRPTPGAGDWRRP